MTLTRGAGLYSPTACLRRTRVVRGSAWSLTSARLSSPSVPLASSSTRCSWGGKARLKLADTANCALARRRCDVLSVAAALAACCMAVSCGVPPRPGCLPGRARRVSVPPPLAVALSHRRRTRRRSQTRCSQAHKTYFCGAEEEDCGSDDEQGRVRGAYVAHRSRAHALAAAWRGWPTAKEALQGTASTSAPSARRQLLT